VTRSQWPEASERCSVRADLRGDPMLGTAFPAARLLLVEQPFPWGPEGLRTSRFVRETALAVEAQAREEGVRVQAIRRPGRGSEGARRRWMLVDTRDGTRSVRCGEFSEDAELLELPLDGSRGGLDPSPIYLVCTHGRHDPCCGQRGRPLVASLAARQPEHVWQASHLGGCRFAPTVLVLPAGVMYGRVPASAAAGVVAAAEAGEVLGGILRGRIGIPPAAQAAIGFAHERLALPRFQDVSLASVLAVDGTTVVVRVDTSRGPFDVTVDRERIDAGGLTCGAPGPSWFVGHRPLTIKPAGDG
jgi:(2Fe-2S) ferredoxin